MFFCCVFIAKDVDLISIACQIWNIGWDFVPDPYI